MRKETPEWRDGLVGLMAESNQSGMGFWFFRSVDTISLLAEAMMGNKTADSLFHAIGRLLKQWQTTPPDQFPLCLCCPRTIRVRPNAIAIIGGISGGAQNYMGSFVCDVCMDGLDYETAATRAVVAFRRLWPDLKLMPEPTHDIVGHG